MEVVLDEFSFSSNFECGNLFKVKQINPPGSGQNKSLPTRKNLKYPISCPVGIVQNHLIDYEFKLWTRPDCGGTEFENNNRTWFCFCIKGGQSGKKVQLSVMNLNKQFKLYSQGMQPVVQCIGDCLQGSKWERIKDKCTYWSEDNSTVVSWVHTVPPDPRATFYAFTYPYSYSELQSYLHQLDTAYLSSPCIYYHRELLTKTLDNSRVDLLTISSPDGKTHDREDHIPDLFPDHTALRPFRFEGKRVVFLSARVHPGETPSSYVLKGFLNFILSKDSMAERIRKQFVFKIIPMLNPDGVKRGHYRTDQRGVNLNRVYMNPSSKFHPSIFASKKLILYHHFGMDLEALYKAEESKTNPRSSVEALPEKLFSNPSLIDEDTCHSFSDAATNKLEPPVNFKESMNKASSLIEVDEPSASGWDCSSNFSVDSSSRLGTFQHEDISNPSFEEGETGMTNMFGCLLPLQDIKTSPKSPSKLISTSLTPDSGKPESIFNVIESPSGLFSDSGKISQEPKTVFVEKSSPQHSLRNPQNFLFSANLKNPETKHLLNTAKQTSKSNLFMYIDLHGHASKRGIFMYGNQFGDTDLMVENMLFPKILSMNCQNFDFAACNFSERNMYHKDRRDGMSKEGSGRVAVMRATGLLRSYTLECNYNTGRLLNPIQSNHHTRSATTFVGVPPKYSPAVFEDCGQKLGMSLFDLIESEDTTAHFSTHALNLNSLKTQIRDSLTTSLRNRHHSPGSLRSKSSIPSKFGPCKSTSDEQFFDKASTSKLLSSPEELTSLKGKAAKLPRLNRKTCWNQSVDAENQEPSLPASKSPEKLSKLKKKDGSSSRTKSKHSKHKISPKKPSRTLFFGKDSGEGSCLADQGQNIAKLTSSKHSLNTSVCLTPNISFKVSIAENTPNPPKLVKKLGKKQRNKNINISTKKLKTTIPFLESDSVDLEKSQAAFSPRSPLASVCEPQPSQSSAEPCMITQPKSPTFAKTSKSSTYSAAKRPTKPSFKSVSKNIDRLPLVSPPNQRMKLFPKKVKKKVPTSPSQAALQWVLREPIQVPEVIEPQKLKIKKRKKTNRKSILD